MKLLQRVPVGEGLHRSGWPEVMCYLRELENSRGLLLDDFADATFSYLEPAISHQEPWVGIFHHPAEVRSPLPGDCSLAVRELDKRHRPHWRMSRPYLQAAITLCDDVGQAVADWLRVPVCSLLHPTQLPERLWDAAAALSHRQLLQVGYCLRNTQLIYQLYVPGWQRGQLMTGSGYYAERDAALRALALRPDRDRRKVYTLQRQSNYAYDALLASSVVVMELYGSAANNVTVECMVRGTPLIVNRLPSVLQYLGDDYPLLYDDVAEIPLLLADESRLIAAHKHLLRRSQILPSFAEFAKSVVAFVDSIGETTHATAAG